MTFPNITKYSAIAAVASTLLAAGCSDLQLGNYDEPPGDSPEPGVFTTEFTTEFTTDVPLFDPAPDTTFSPANSSLTLTPPAVLLQSRMVDPQQLRAEVTVLPGGVVTMTPNAERTQWSGVIDVPINTDASVTIEWFETFSARDLQLASLQQIVSVGVDATTVAFDASQYQTTIHDDDDDGVSNLEERNASTDPFNVRDAPPPDPGSDTAISAVIPLVNTGTVPQIDGLGATYAANELRLAGEWGSAVQEGAQGELFIDSLMINEGNEDIDTEPFHSWAALHDGSFLYILVLVDDASRNQGDSADLRDDDSIEIFIDGDNSNNSSYGDADDRYFRIGLLSADGSVPHTNESPEPRIERGQNSAPIPGNIEFATGLAAGPLSIASPGERLDVYEVKIELASFGISAGQPFGLEVQINDDDNGEIRNQKWGWFHPVKRGSGLNLTVDNPAFMGTVELAQ